MGEEEEEEEEQEEKKEEKNMLKTEKKKKYVLEIYKQPLPYTIHSKINVIFHSPFLLLFLFVLYFFFFSFLSLPCCIPSFFQIGNLHSNKSVQVLSNSEV